MEHAYKVLVAKPKEEKSLGRPNSRWKIILKFISENMVLGCGLD
jgi:hypothetical protein